MKIKKRFVCTVHRRPTFTFVLQNFRIMLLSRGESMHACKDWRDVNCTRKIIEKKQTHCEEKRKEFTNRNYSGMHQLLPDYVLEKIRKNMQINRSCICVWTIDELDSILIKELDKLYVSKPFACLKLMEPNCTAMILTLIYWHLACL